MGYVVFARTFLAKRPNPDPAANERTPNTSSLVNIIRPEVRGVNRVVRDIPASPSPTGWNRPPITRRSRRGPQRDAWRVCRAHLLRYRARLHCLPGYQGNRMKQN
jgi:hypothetical protein